MTKTAGNSVVKIDANGIFYKELNAQLRELVAKDVRKIEITNVCGQRYIGTDLNAPVQIDLYGTPGNDLGAFMNGPKIVVHGNAQDGTGNTMNEGEIVVHGHAGDVLGMSARGGKIFVRDSIGYRAAIHMKEYKEKKPSVVIGGTAQDFFGEYMAGGILVLLGLNLAEGELHKAKYIAVGMHGGVIYLRGSVEPYQLGPEVGIAELDENDNQVLKALVNEYSGHFGYPAEKILSGKFIKPHPRFLRPYGRLYAY